MSDLVIWITLFKKNICVRPACALLSLWGEGVRLAVLKHSCGERGMMRAGWWKPSVNLTAYVWETHLSCSLLFYPECSHGVSILSNEYVGWEIWLRRDKGAHCLLGFLLRSFFISRRRSGSVCRWKSSLKCAGTIAIRLLPRQRVSHTPMSGEPCSYIHWQALSCSISQSLHHHLLWSLSLFISVVHICHFFRDAPVTLFPCSSHQSCLEGGVV